MINDINIFTDTDINLSILKDKKIGIIGYGNQGRAQCLNLRDSNLNVKVGIRNNSNSIVRLNKDNIKYDTIENVVKWADIISILVPDKVTPDVYEKSIKSNLIER